MSPFRPRIRHDLDLERSWRVIAPAEGPRPHAFWIMLLGDGGRAFTEVVQVEDAYDVPAPDRTHVFSDFLRELVGHAGGPVTQVAFLRTRPGAFGPGDDDLAWGACLHTVAREADLACATVFLATDLVLVPLPSDGAGCLASA